MGNKGRAIDERCEVLWPGVSGEAVGKQVGCRIDDTEASSRNVLLGSERVVVGANSDVVE